MIRTAAIATLGAIAYLTAPAADAAPLCDKLGFAGLLAKCNKGEEINLTLAAGKPLADGPITLQSGAYYEMIITADGSQELALTGPSFFRAVWMDEIVINEIEIRPMAIDSFEFDDEGEAEFSFVAIKPGRYHLMIPGSTGESQRVDITIQ
ncbi:MAG: hypothetical protein AAF360_02425 [Pseudomonadota bacterium]